MAQPPNSGSLEQVLRCLQKLALTAAYTTELQILVGYMGPGALQPGNFRDANGAFFQISLNDTQFGDPASWMPTGYKNALITSQLHIAGPFPAIQLLGASGIGVPMTSGGYMEFDTSEAVGWGYTVDAVSIAQADRAEVAARTAMVMSHAFEHLVRRNTSLGGLVQIISSEGPPAPGGEMEGEGLGILSGVLQRFRVDVINRI